MLIRVLAVQWARSGPTPPRSSLGWPCAAFAWPVPAGVTIGLRPRLGARPPGYGWKTHRLSMSTFDR
jgi:hypothetical protein